MIRRLAMLLRNSVRGPRPASGSLRPQRAVHGGSLVLVFLLLCGQAGAAVTLAELRADPNLTPEQLMRYVADFKFDLSRDVHTPEDFLARQAGDCDDFANLAADLLREKGYSTKLVAVFMPNDVHVVCYVAETKAYLDFNRRKKASPLVNCKAELSAIASSVARSFRTQWRSVSEFTLKKGVRQFVWTVFR